MQEMIEKYNINILCGIYIFGIIMTSVSALLSIYGNSFGIWRYGKVKKNVNQRNIFLDKWEVPKSWFCHFYTYAIGWALFSSYLIINSVIRQKPAPEYVLNFLDVISGGQRNRTVLINSTSALLAVVLMTLQVVRRFYETNFVQIFSKKCTMTLFLYIISHIFYSGLFLSFLSNTEGFVRDSWPRRFSLHQITITQFVCSGLFLYSWLQQWKANIILVNLRKDEKNGKVNTEQHYLPKGGIFDLISSPHMFFEIAMYASILGIIPNSFIYKIIVMIVLINQVTIALLTHKWYKENFKNYPKHRKAIIPFLL